MGGSITVMDSGNNQARFYGGLDANEHGYLSLVENDGATGGLYLTGNSAGTNWILGKVGIGIAAPVAKLHIDDSATGDNKALYIQNTHNANNDTAAIRFGFSGTDNANKGGIFLNEQPHTGEVR